MSVRRIEKSDAVAVGDEAYVEVITRPSFAARHAVTLGVLIHRAEDAERGTTYEVMTAPNEEHAAYVTAAIVTAWSFVEAVVNEVFADCADGRAPVGLPEPISSRLGRLWTGKKLRRMTTMEKADEALSTAGAASLRGSHLHQRADSVRALRNALVHAHPEDIVLVTTLPGTRPTEKPLWRRLRKQFDLHPRMGGTQAAFFPSQVTSASCARWARHSVIAYLDEFHRRLRIKPRYESIGAAALDEARKTKR